MIGRRKRRGIKSKLRNKKGPMITLRDISKEEIEQIWGIDRSEVIENIYYFENNALVLKSEYYNVTGWPPGEAEKYQPILVACNEQGGWFHGIFDDSKLVGAAVLDNRFIGKSKDMLQLKFLHISNAYRKNGFGRQLFGLARTIAGERGARKLYISATPSENTINFYLSLGCEVTPEPDPNLFELEPEDIHFVCST